MARRYGIEVALDMFADLFQRRRNGEDIKLSRALERNFDDPSTPVERQIRADIEAYRASQVAKCETELFAQKRRLTDAQRGLQVKETRKAREEIRIATNKIRMYLDRLADMRRAEPKEDDSRIFPMGYAPVIANIDGRLMFAPMRYTCRLGGKPANYDVRFPGTYNARRDSLTGFWDAIYGRNHAVMVVSGFFENVPRHLYERRELQPHEKPANVVLRFNPRPAMEMLVACLWDHWSGPGAPDLWSFAAVTDAPPAEIAVTGHQRCVVALREPNMREWLSPRESGRNRLDAILGDRETPYYEHRIAA
jgi:putative SOS response-associated peptidase YedK